MPPPSVGVLLPRDLPAHRVLEHARRAEALGFDELWVVEDLGFRGGAAQAAAVLAATERIHVGIGIVPAAARDVAFAAMDAATLARLFPGRVTFGVGHGMPDWMRSVGAWPARPLTYLEAYTRALRALLRGERVTTASDAPVVLDGVALDPSSVPDVVPDVLLGVRGPRSLAAAGRVADGVVLAEPCAPAYVRAAVEHVAAPGTRVVTYDVAAVDDDRARALDVARPGLAWVGEPDWSPHVAPLPFAADLAALRARSASPAAFAAALPDAWVRELALAGTPDDVRERIAARGAAGATSCVLFPTGPDPVAALEALARVR
ncbi:LLM class flavin-dependent oxidoreductase [Cellulomonas dongxiuzhuiae]|uniref:LLM class flavin-dependent oxidoreductase n=1 Tax=Cellulomonas dongxiuzhuiae TaxID=2819979 RepID=A0ABX8GKU0_9CELL|nr:LLM class flavin-dependent oxidoreductase [Cellulomonas dongxiuzhuiae]MBO3094826.1 LLM class flavin-dependent oxidoreductase [Cellulomonas dongxiuzhuiae]QWC15859.1 LLM class flavin-dependent oxidoreductase [Cellulomonas dongxiuzhuiae]